MNDGSGGPYRSIAWRTDLFVVRCVRLVNREIPPRGELFASPGGNLCLHRFQM
jgi:hypothetical protein